MRKKQRDTGELGDLITLIQETLDQCQKKFADPRTGRGPSCILSVRMHSLTRMSGYYLPILNHWGWNEYDHMVYGDGVFSLPFSHEDIWRYLTGTMTQPAPSELVFATRGRWKAVVGGIRVGQIFFVRESAEYRKLGLEEQIKGGSMNRGPAFVASQMRRSWEDTPLTHTTKTCAFCRGEVNNPVSRGDFIIFDNRFKPHPWHKVVVPSKTFLQQFPPDPLTRLLHPKMLSGMLNLMPELWGQRKELSQRVQCGLHFGVSAGQTMSHPHLHARQ